jgi:amidophosphoribosyltransferase
MDGITLTPEVEQQMARAIGADSLRYLPIESISRCVDLERNSLCQACIDGNYPTPAGRELYQIALNNGGGNDNGSSRRTYDAP